jgi:APA family basic amino acid/polyamine antiporter
VSGEADRWGERLPRRLGAWSAIAVVVGSTIGSGIFRTPAVVAERVTDPVLFAGVWIFGAVIALAGALTYAELSAMIPRSGGIYVYLREAFGRLPAFLFGWSELVILRPAAYGAIAVTSAEYLWRVAGVDGGVSAFGSPLTIAQVMAAAMIVVVGAINYQGIALGAVVQNVSTVLKVGALLVLIALGLFIGAEPPSTPAPVAATAEASVVSGFLLAMVSVLWAYDGWSDVGFVSGEVADPQRSLPRAFFLGTAAVAALYLLATAAYTAVVPLSHMPGSELIAADVASAVIGPAGVVFVSAAVMLSTFGTLNGSMMTGPRVFFAMAEDGLFFKSLARVQPKYGTPGGAIVLSVVLGVVFVSVRTFAELADQFVIGIWPFYALGVLAVFVLRRAQPDRERPYRTWGYPWVPGIFLAATVFLLGNYLVREPVIFAADVAVILAGVPVYWFWRRRGAAGPA